MSGTDKLRVLFRWDKAVTKYANGDRSTWKIRRNEFEGVNFLKCQSCCLTTSMIPLEKDFTWLCLDQIE